MGTLWIRPYPTTSQVGIAMRLFSRETQGKKDRLGFVLSYRQTHSVMFSYFSCIFLLLFYLIMELVACFFG